MDKKKCGSHTTELLIPKEVKLLEKSNYQDRKNINDRQGLRGKEE